MKRLKARGLTPISVKKAQGLFANSGKSDKRNPEKKDNDLLDLASMGFNADNYTPPTSTQKEQIKGLIEVVLKDNKKGDKK